MSAIVPIDRRVTGPNGQYNTITQQPYNLGIPMDLDLPIAKTGQLTTRTNNTDGTLTMAGGHGIITGNRLDIYWFVAGVYGVAYGATVGTVAGNAVPFTGATCLTSDGSNVLPVNLSNVTAMVPVREDVQLVGGNAVGILLQDSGWGGTFVFATSVPANIWARAFFPNGGSVQSYAWLNIADGAADNPITGQTVRYVYLSHGDVVATRKLRGFVMYN